MGHLACGFYVELRLIGQHAAKHRDIDGHAILAQQCQLFLFWRTFLFCQTMSQRFYRLELCQADMHQLLSFSVGEYIFCLLICFYFAEAVCDALYPFDRFFRINTFFNQDLRRLARNTPAADTDISGKRLFKQLGSAPCTLQTLRRNAQARCTAEYDRFRRTGIVTVQVGGWISGQ